MFLGCDPETTYTDFIFLNKLDKLVGRHKHEKSIA